MKPEDESAARELQRRRRFELVVHLLRLFEGLDAEILEELVPEVEWLSLRSGETLFRQGDVPDAVFFVISGRLRVVAELTPSQMCSARWLTQYMAPRAVWRIFPAPA